MSGDYFYPQEVGALRCALRWLADSRVYGLSADEIVAFAERELAASAARSVAHDALVDAMFRERIENMGRAA